ncbi:hypothetical protein [Vibrio phage vB_VpM-pA2SJ1]|uniref:Uncharacterized protein n=1 Tax=Vibrio phage vB_VpM-pA2SJ1 TaxID=3095964 RepID=A0AAX4J580_9CAUD
MVTSLHLIALSHHISTNGLNEVNPGFMIEHNTYIAGMFENSYEDLTLIAGKKFEHETEWVNIGFMAGAVVGYEEHQVPIYIAGVTPYVAPYVQVNTPYVKPTVALFGEALTLSFEIEF